MLPANSKIHPHLAGGRVLISGPACHYVTMYVFCHTDCYTIVPQLWHHYHQKPTT